MEMRLDRLMREYLPAYGDWWAGTFADLWADPSDRELIERLMVDVGERGIRSPIALSEDDDLSDDWPDPRVLNGIHRLCAAHRLGLEAVPVRFGLPPGDSMVEYEVSFDVDPPEAEGLLDQMPSLLSFRLDNLWFESNVTAWIDGRFEAIVSAPGEVSPDRLRTALIGRLEHPDLHLRRVEPE